MAVQREVDLSHANTLRLPCVAERYAAPRTLNQLQSVLAQANRLGWAVTLLGGGSNVLLPARLSGIVIRPAFAQWWLKAEGNQLFAHVGAGVNWHRLVMELAAAGLWGTENLALIPGDCGAAPVQNIGAYGVELADVIEAVQVVDRSSGHVRWLNRDACQFGYRDSIFKGALAENVVISQLVLRLSRLPMAKLGYGDLASRLPESPTPLAVANAVCAIRREKLPDPEELANAGSFFKNPFVTDQVADELRQQYPDMPCFPQGDGRTKLAAGWLIDQCGLKGFRQGAFAVHQRQALVLVHFGGGNRQGLLALARTVSEKVAARFGVTLTPEPRLITG
ncbi:UDP-N-acetylmuramate dehydrogenase [Vreelandella arcis]|uniref:UDP-N-acetylenolpyruvoylglucosamine reductase n=1 Tax=Vreelandella arcis TaxID=416873 RepID=A0A1G9ZMV2_9GAMM|nr:UDP-N-acetylmuramate dehydrogenase [Halomonas arcis]